MFLALSELHTMLILWLKMTYNVISTTTVAISLSAWVLSVIWTETTSPALKERPG